MEIETLKTAMQVSTHSRLKAAGLFLIGLFLFRYCFNTQPPEGGWASILRTLNSHTLFQHTAA